MRTQCLLLLIILGLIHYFISRKYLKTLKNENLFLTSILKYHEIIRCKNNFLFQLILYFQDL